MTLAPGLVDDITIVVGSRWSDAEADLDRHGQDESWHHPMPPDLVVYPHSTEEVAAVVRGRRRLVHQQQHAQMGTIRYRIR